MDTRTRQKAAESFIEKMSHQYDTETVLKTALKELASFYQVARIDLEMRVNQSTFTPRGDNRRITIFKTRKKASPEPISQIVFKFAEPGTATFTTYLEADAKPWTAEQGDEWKAIMNIIYIHSGRKNLVEKLQDHKLHDALTGVANAAGFMQHAQKLLRQHTLDQYCAFFFNLKAFSLTNRKFGSAETDRIIVRYAEKVNSMLLGEEILGRLGGDNFVALIMKGHVDDFLKLLSGVETYAEYGGRKTSVSISAVSGAWMIEEGTSDVGELISRPSMALSVAKYVKKVPNVFCTQEVVDSMLRTRVLETSFDRALNECEFVAFYQPKVDLLTYRITGAEALVRWSYHGDLMPPLDFVPVFEKSGYVQELDFYMLEVVCQDIKRWEQMGLQPVRVSVNFSRKHLDNDHLAEDIVSMVDRYEVDRKYIEIEVTETVEEAEKAQLKNFLNKMHMFKIATAIDDFGTGFSSLNMLREFQVDSLKVDRSFITKTDWVDKVVLQNIIRLATDLKLDVIVEGVETVEQMIFLQKNNCRYAQGFLFDKPLPRDDFEQRLETMVYQDPFIS